MTKKEVIEQLINDVDFNIYKNELVISYKEKGNESNADIEKTKEVIKRDKEYRDFLTSELSVSN